CDSLTISLDVDSYYMRVSSYHDPYDPDDYYFLSFETCYLTVTGIEINPPLPDILMAPGTTNSSIDLDEHVGLASIPDSLFVWSASGNNRIGVTINPVTHVVTFNAPEDFHGYEDIKFTVSDGNGAVSASDIMRVTVDEYPQLIEDAIPDTVYIHEDSLEVALILSEIVEDKDDVFADLIWFFKTGLNLTYSTRGDSLFLKGSQNYNGMDQLGIAVYDRFALGDSLTVPVRVLPVNDSPVMKNLPSVTIERGDSYQLQMEQYASDIDGDRLTLSWEPARNIQIGADEMMVTITGRSGFLGSEDVVFIVTDPEGLSARGTLKVTVTPAKKPPVWSHIPKIGFAQGHSDSSLVLWDYVSDPDDPDSLLTFDITNDEDVDLWFVNYTDGRLYLYDLNNLPGWDKLTVSAADPDGNFSSTQFIVFIAPADGTPIVAGIPDTTIVAGTESNWIDLDDFYYDIDNTDNQMTWTWDYQARADSAVTVLINQMTHRVLLRSYNKNIYGIEKIIFTVTDPDKKSGDDVCIITVLEDVFKPVLDLPPKIGFVAGKRDSLDLDDYVYDAEYDKSVLSWAWFGNRRCSITLQAPNSLQTRPVTFTGPDDWIGFERVEFIVTNPMGGAAKDTLTVFSVPGDGRPVAGGLSGISLRAGECVSVNLDDYFYDADTPDFMMTWTVSGNDSISVSIDPFTHIAHICAVSESWEGQEKLQFLVTDSENNSSSMEVTVSVTGAVLRHMFTVMIFRNPMQEDYMDLFIKSEKATAGLPKLVIKAERDSTTVSVKTIEPNYFYGRYLLPLDMSIGVKGTAHVIVSGLTATGKAVQDTSYFAYGRIGSGGGKIAFNSMNINIPAGALSKPSLITMVPGTHGDMSVSSSVPQEVMFTGEFYYIGPSSLHAEVPCDIGFSVSKDRFGAGVYQFYDGVWNYIGSDRVNGGIQAEIFRGGIFCLGYDRTPPQLRLVESSSGTMEVLVSDYGSGLDVSSIRVMSENSGIKWDFDPENAILTVNVTDREMNGDVQFDISVADRSGNTTVQTISNRVEGIPGQFFVEQNTPNPFNPLTHITFVMTSDERVNIEIYDLLGRKVKDLVSDHFTAGRHTVVWDAHDDGGHVVSSGVYFYRVSTDSRAITRKMLFLR
ncbi:MAG TPA: Ig-like domain-containing protein, partial [Anaerolineae bacterium]|nr:Ig-like domain-containing protein [Anaerolineae bacterium]